MTEILSINEELIKSLAEDLFSNPISIPVFPSIVKAYQERDETYRKVNSPEKIARFNELEKSYYNYEAYMKERAEVEIAILEEEDTMNNHPDR